jgi:hypothetical protein
VYYVAGLVNYCVPAGEAHRKALEIARDVNQKVKVSLAHSIWKKSCLVYKSMQFC